MIADASSKTLLKALKSKVLPDSIVYTDSFGSYDALDVSGFKHRRVNHSKTFVSPRWHHINGIPRNDGDQACPVRSQTKMMIGIGIPMIQNKTERMTLFSRSDVLRQRKPHGA